MVICNDLMTALDTPPMYSKEGASKANSAANGAYNGAANGVGDATCQINARGVPVHSDHQDLPNSFQPDRCVGVGSGGVGVS